MIRRTFFRSPHTCDIQNKITYTNSTGQRMADWATSQEDVPCSLVPAGTRSSLRVTPTTEERDWITMTFPHDCVLSYNSRVINIRHKFQKTGKVEYLYPGTTFEVAQIDRPVGYTGRVLYLNVHLKSVIE